MSVGNSFFTSQFIQGINELQKAISDLDKIATTPLPSAYRSQLRLTVWAYLFFLPVQLYQYLGWVTIPAVAIAAVIYLGFLVCQPTYVPTSTDDDRRRLEARSRCPLGTNSPILIWTSIAPTSLGNWRKLQR